MPNNAPSTSRDEYLGQVDVRHLSHYKWPIMRAVASRFVDRLELRHHQRQLLSSGKWRVIRAEPHRDEAGIASMDVFDLYASPASDPSVSSCAADEAQ